MIYLSFRAICITKDQTGRDFLVKKWQIIISEIASKKLTENWIQDLFWFMYNDLCPFYLIWHGYCPSKQEFVPWMTQNEPRGQLIIIGWMNASCKVVVTFGRWRRQIQPPERDNAPLTLTESVFVWFLFLEKQDFCSWREGNVVARWWCRGVLARFRSVSVLICFSLVGV